MKIIDSFKSTSYDINYYLKYFDYQTTVKYDKGDYLVFIHDNIEYVFSIENLINRTGIFFYYRIQFVGKRTPL